MAPPNHLRAAWRLFKRHWLAFVLAQLAVVSAWIALEVAVVTAHGSGIPPVVYWPVWLCLHLAFFWLFCGLMAGIYSMALQAVDGDVPTFLATFGRLDRGRAYFLTSLVYWAAVVGGLCLVVVPGVIAAVRWSLFRFVLAANANSVLPSLHESASLSVSRRWPLFRVLIISAALNLAGAAVLGLGLLIAFPVTLMLRASHFRALQQLAAASGHNPALSTTRIT
jgi:uncharacterized membrane protein